MASGPWACSLLASGAPLGTLRLRGFLLPQPGGKRGLWVSCAWTPHGCTHKDHNFLVLFIMPPLIPGAVVTTSRSLEERRMPDGR